MNQKTIAYYDYNAQEYFNTVNSADMSENCERFLNYLKPGSSIIDLGCGSGRDLKYFKEHGYLAEGLDASKNLCKLARDYSGCPVICTDFQNWKPDKQYDAFWANASLLHLEEEEILDFFKEKTKYLKKDGIVYFSMKSGIPSGSDEKGRFFTPFTEELLSKILSNPSLTLLNHRANADSLGRKDTSWVSVLLRKS